VVSHSKSSRAAVRSGDHDLIGVLLPEVANGEDARDTRLAFLIRYDIAT